MLRFLTIRAVGMLLVGTFTGLTVSLFIYGIEGAWHPEAGVFSGIVYTVVMWAALETTVRTLHRHLAPWSVRAAILHGGGVALAMVASFAVASGVLALLNATGEVPGPVIWGVIGMVSVFAALVVTGTFYLAGLSKRAHEAEAAAVHAELQALRAQVNPHFLFNALNSIAALIRTRPREAETMVENLADLFRYSLQASHRVSVSLEEELESVRTYLGLEQVRFGSRLQVELALTEDALRAEIPTLVLQPLVENAIKHGAGVVEGICSITIHGVVRDGGVELAVTDSGPGFTETEPGTVMSRGTGLANVSRRLELFFGPAATMEIRRDGIVLRFPYRPAAGADLPNPSAMPAATHR
jgi:two-component system, LytTR family, sensor histidine kinase AlgZ